MKKRRKEERNKKCCMKQESKVGYRDIFRQTEYMKIMIAALINRFGDSIDALASTWIVYEITGNAAWSAIIYGVNRIPSIIITPLAGAWVEGQKKKTIIWPAYILICKPADWPYHTAISPQENSKSQNTQTPILMRLC